MEPLSPSQWLVVRLALRVGEPFETWDLVKVLRGDPGLPELHYKTIARTSSGWSSAAISSAK